MKTISTFLLLLLPLMCSKSPDEVSVYNEPNMLPSEVAYDLQISASNPEDQNIGAAAEQKLIKESVLRFETQDLDKTYKNISKFVIKNNGYVQDDDASKSYNRISRRLIIRIPTDKFQATIDSIAADVSFFDTKQITSKDVTEEFIDLEARLKAKQSLEARYLELLNKASNVKEILEIERELSVIREEIESKQGRLKYLQNKVSLSTLTVEFYKITSESGIRVSYGQKMWNAITSGFNGLSLFFLGILHIWPFILIVLVLIFILRRWLKRKNNLEK